METKTITRVNNVNIVLSNDGNKLVPIKPICDALGIDYSRQVKKIKEDEDLSSTVGVTPTVAADGKEREMLCLPLEYVFGWLFTINPNNVNGESRDTVRKFRMQCYHALYMYFFGGQQKLIEQNQQEISLLEEIADLNTQQSQIKVSISEKKKKLEKIREDRLHNEPTLFD